MLKQVADAEAEGWVLRQVRQVRPVRRMGDAEDYR